MEYTDERAALAGLATIKFARLEQRDPTEAARLLEACTVFGFFYLDFSGSEMGEKIVEGKAEVLRWMRGYFTQPLDVKLEDDKHSRIRGYIPSGAFNGVGEGNKESYEHISLGRDELMQSSPSVLGAVQDRRALFKAYFERNTYGINVMLASLSDALGLAGPARLERGHSLEAPSETILAMLSYPTTGTSHNKHTDMGSLTILFSDEWGLQVLAPQTGTWEFIEPRQNLAVVNVGDALRFLSGLRLKSCLHRVIRATGARETNHRYSLAFLVRPEDGLRFTDLNGRSVSMKEWHDRKHEVYAEPHETGDKDPRMTGGMEQLLAQPIAVM